MSTYELIALDMDGTLLNSQHEITPVTCTAINKAIDAGKTVIISTGRSVGELDDYKEEMKHIPYFNCENGALLYDNQNDKIIHQVSLTPEIMFQIFELIEGEDVMLYFASDGGIVTEKHKIPLMDHYLIGQYRGLMERTARHPVDDIIKYYKEHLCSVEKFNIFSPSPEVRQRIFEKLQSLPISMVFAEIASLEIGPEHMSKAYGLKKMCEYLELPMEQTISVGDSDNDLKVMEASGLAVAMGNARPHIKEISDVIVNDNDHDGCAEAIEKYLL